MAYLSIATTVLTSALVATAASPVAADAVADRAARISCASEAGARVYCPADTSAGVLLVRSSGPGPCLLGKSWGYDDAGVWVADGCAGEFALGPPATEGDEDVAEEPPDASKGKQPTQPIESWGQYEPGKGLLVGKGKAGQLSISAYALLRYINQLPAEQTFTDHLGNEHPVDTRQDFFPHRIMIFFTGWLGTPKLVYNIFLWTVNATDQDALFAVLGYQFNRKISIYGGLNGLPGTRSLQGSHPYWLGHDRVMADEFFRPYFGFGVWAQGEIRPGLWYNAQVANTSSSLGVKSSQLDREFSTGASMWWMPTTHEFGPKGAYGDYEMHEKVATRFGFSTAFSPEQRFTDSTTGASGNTTIRLADSLNVFDTGSLAPGVTVENLDYRLLAVDLGVKYRGFFFQTEAYQRQLDGFDADGLLPVEEIVDTGFYVQAAFYPVPKKLELYVATSQIFGDKDAGFDDSSEYLIGTNFYPLKTRNHRLNVQVIDVKRSPVSSSFGYYVGGQDGTTTSVAFSIFF